MAELPQFVEAHRKWSSQGLRVILASVDMLEGSTREEAVRKVELARQKVGVPTDVWVHTGEMDPLSKLLGSEMNIPPVTGFFKDGKLVRSVDGAFKEGELERALREVKLIGT